jgi:signal recognition particle GTPase
MDFVLKNDSQSDIILENEDMPYKEKIYMTFPRIGDKKVNNQKIILKKNSIIFFEFKSAFPQFKWREKFSHLFKKVEKFIKIYQNRGLSYNNECIQIYLIYDNIPDLYNINSMKSYINQQFSNLFKKFEFGLYYFSKGITIINNQILEKRLKNNLKKELENKLKKELENNLKKELENKLKKELENNLKKELENKLKKELESKLKKELEKKMDDLYNIFKLIKDENVQKELQKVFEKK